MKSFNKAVPIINKLNLVVKTMGVDLGKKRAGLQGFYKPSTDTIVLRNQEDNLKARVFFHELIHWTGHSKRLSRLGIVPLESGQESLPSHYILEEIVAELGSLELLKLYNIYDARNEEHVRNILRGVPSSYLYAGDRLMREAVSYLMKQIYSEVFYADSPRASAVRAAT